MGSYFTRQTSQLLFYQTVGDAFIEDELSFFCNSGCNKVVKA